jgi:hypothetical protein
VCRGASGKVQFEGAHEGVLMIERAAVALPHLERSAQRL